MKKVSDFELVDHGIEGSQYFQGCGTSHTPFAYVVTGCGDNPREALDDALEIAAQGDPSIDVADLERRILEEEGVEAFPETPSASEGTEEDEESDTYYYLSIRYNVEA